jgi:hypothetical protein
MLTFDDKEDDSAEAEAKVDEANEDSSTEK